jgi:hypothetical protein
MRSVRIGVFAAGVLAMALGIYAETGFSEQNENAKGQPVDIAVARGFEWLVSVQGKDGGWGQDGGEASYVRPGEHLESIGNDVADTAVVAEALLHAGTTVAHRDYREPLRRAVDFILKHVEQSPDEGLAVTDLRGTQIQRKLGPYIDTFVTAKLLAELDGTMPDAKSGARVRQALQKCVAKIEKSQLTDGSWNLTGGWAPILGTSMASQSLNIAMAKGAVNAQNAQVAMDGVAVYTARSAAAPSAAASTVAVAGVGSGGGVGSGSGGGVGPSVADSVVVTASPAAGVSGPSAGVSAVSAGVPLYKKAQELEQFTRTEKDREKNAKQIHEIAVQLSDPKFIAGFGSVGGEEFFSYLNISESLRRTGGPEWKKWNAGMTAKVLRMQSEDGTWAGQHCITGRVAVTSAAILLLTADREPAPVTRPGISGR